MHGDCLLVVGLKGYPDFILHYIEVFTDCVDKNEPGREKTCIRSFHYESRRSQPAQADYE